MNITITPEGVVSNDGKVIGTIEEGVLKHSASISAPVKGAIRKAAGNPELKFQDITPVPPSAAPQATPPVIEPPASIGPPLTDEELLELVKQRGLTIQVPAAPAVPIVPADPATYVTEGSPQRRALGILLARAEKGDIPPPPPRSQAGDKTPEFVEWFRTHATTEEFEEQYGGRDLGPRKARSIQNEK